MHLNIAALHGLSMITLHLVQMLLWRRYWDISRVIQLRELLLSLLRLRQSSLKIGILIETILTLQLLLVVKLLIRDLLIDTWYLLLL